MAKVIKYQRLVGEINHGTEENPDIQQIVTGKEIECKTQAVYDANYPIAEKEAIPDTIEVSGEFEPEPDPEPSEAERIAELEEALEMLLNGVTE